MTLSTPVGAAGLVTPTTSGWWHKLVTAEIALIFVKPIVALVLAVGFTVANDGTGIQGALVGFMILAAAAVAWPVVAHMFTFFEGQVAIGGLAAAMGMAGVGRFGGGLSNGSQPMWQSMEQASSRSGGGLSPLGTAGGAADVALAGSGGVTASAGELGSAAATVGSSPAAVGAGGLAGPVAAGVVLGKQAATKAATAPGRLLGRAGEMAGDGRESPGMWAQQALAPTEPPPGNGGQGAS